MTGGVKNNISFVLGQLDASVEDLGRSFEKHCADDDRRHDENLGTLRQLNATLGELRDIVRPLAEAVEKMRPIVDSVQISRWKIAGGVTVASFFLAGLGWLLSFVSAKAFAWLAGHIKL